MNAQGSGLRAQGKWHLQKLSKVPYTELSALRPVLNRPQRCNHHSFNGMQPVFSFVEYY